MFRLLFMILVVIAGSLRWDGALAQELLYADGFEQTRITFTILNPDDSPAVATVYDDRGNVLGTTTPTGQYLYSGPSTERRVYFRSTSSSLQVSALAGRPATPLAAAMTLQLTSDHPFPINGDIPQLVDGLVLPLSASFQWNFGSQPFSSISSVYLVNASEMTLDLRAYASVSNGRVSFSGAGLSTALSGFAGTGIVTLVGDLVDVNGVYYTAQRQLTIGTSSLAITAVAPPSLPALSVSGIPVRLTAQFGNTRFIRHVTTGTNGTVTTQGLPPATLRVEAGVTVNGIAYTVDNSVAIPKNQAVSIRIRPIGPVDVANGVPDLELVSPAPVPEGIRVEAPNAIPSFGPKGATSVRAVSGAQNVTVSDHQAITATQGQANLTLTYIIRSAEYPTFVHQQSVFNDQWTLALVAPDGQRLFSLGRSVNSMLSQQPVFLNDGTTGSLTQRINVSPYTANGPATFQLIATSKNIGDSAFATTVEGTVGDVCTVIRAGEACTIRITDIGTNASGVVIPHASPILRISLPGSDGITNANVGGGIVNERYVTFETEPDMGPALNVNVIIAAASGSPVLNTTSRVATQTAPGKYIVKATFDSATAITGDVDKVRYRISQGATQSDPSAAVVALWSAPPGEARFGKAEVDGDGWRTRCTRTWLTQNASIGIIRNDVSYQHGRAREVGSTHRYGRHVDAFHAVDLAPSVPFSKEGKGTANYTAFENLAIHASRGDPGSKAALASYISSQRNRIGQYLAGGAGQVITALGNSINSTISGTTVTVGSGWAQQLLQTGKLSYKINGADALLDLQLPSYTTPQGLLFRADHNNHDHIDLMGVNSSSQCETG